MKNKTKFKELMATMGELFDKPITGLLSTVYWKVLESFTDEECEDAFRQIILESRFFPKPAELVELLRGRKGDQAAAAWIRVIEAMRRHGEYASVSFDDPIIHGVIEFMGGWPAVGNWPEDELKWKQREFEKLYAIMQKRGTYPDHLPGIHEIENGGRGPAVEIVKIGNGAAQVKQIAANG